MEISAKFEKVSYEIFENSCHSLIPWLNEDEISTAYESIKLPARATKGSAGYDFFSPFALPEGLDVGESLIFPTGIRCKMNEGWVLVICPRSGMGFKSGVRLANTLGIIDQDYYYSDNEGHIMIKLINESTIAKKLDINSGTAFCQGILLPYGIAENDSADAVRNGGFGSTSA